MKILDWHLLLPVIPVIEFVSAIYILKLYSSWFQIYWNFSFLLLEHKQKKILAVCVLLLFHQKVLFNTYMLNNWVIF